MLLRQLRDAYSARARRRTAGSCAQACEDAGGRELDDEGDSFFVAFRRPTDSAVDAAVAAQRALADA